MLSMPSWCDCLMLKTPLAKMKKKPSTMILYILLWVVVELLLWAFVYPTIDISEFPHILWVYFMSGVSIASLVFAIISARKDPGYLTKPDIPFIDLLNKFDSTMLCPECEVIRTAWSKHCSICGQCVERFDHHCPWINNCVGLKNHSYFVLFLLFTEVSLIMMIVMLAIKINAYY